MPENCIFCKILAKEVPSKTIVESDLCVAIEDIFPQAPVHALIIPRRHIVSLQTTMDDDGALLGEMLLLARRCAGAKGVAASGYRVITNIGADGGQEVPHIHFHLLGGKRLGGKLVHQ